MNEKKFKELLGLKIRNQRNKLNLTQEQFSERIGISQRQISLIELGKSFPKPVTLLNIAQICECEISDLFDFESVISEKELKNKLIKLIDKFSYDKLKFLYMLSKNI